MFNIHLLIGIIISIVSIILGYKVGRRDGEHAGKVDLLYMLDIFDESGEVVKSVNNIMIQAYQMSDEEFDAKVAERLHLNLDDFNE